MNFQEFKEKYQHKKVEEYPNRAITSPVVSVCVQTYQHAPFIKECLDGILMQKTDFPFEILLGEDGSSDGTREICIAYAKKYPDKIRLFLHHRENNIKVFERPTGRFNFLYNGYSAKGKYIAFCEGDDSWIDPLKLQKQVDYLNRNKDCSIVFTGFKIIAPNGKISRVIKYKALDKMDANEFIRTSYYTRFVTLLIKNEVLTQTPDRSWMVRSFAADFIIKYRALLVGDFGYINDITCAYNGSTEGSFSKRNLTKPIVLKEYKDYMRGLYYLDYFCTLNKAAKKKKVISLKQDVYFKMARSKKNKIKGLIYLVCNIKNVSIYHIFLFIKREFLA